VRGCAQDPDPAGSAPQQPGQHLRAPAPALTSADGVFGRSRDVNDPVRRNIEFFIGLRSKIEHRYAAKAHLPLAASLDGHAQALLLNYEEELVGQFGEAASLATRLRFPVFIGSFTDAGETTLRRLCKSLPAALRSFIAEYEAGLPPELVNDRRYEFRLRVLNELAPRNQNPSLHHRPRRSVSLQRSRSRSSGPVSPWSTVRTEARTVSHQTLTDKAAVLCGSLRRPGTGLL
jgi:hypothetical protein